MRIMKKYRILVLLMMLFLVTSVSASALDWHDKLVQELMEKNQVEKSVVVERGQFNKRITKANYKFSFDIMDDGTFKLIKNTLISHSNDAIKFSTQGSDGTILMQVYEAPGRFYSYKFYKSSPKEYTLIISVGGTSKPISMFDGDKDFEQLEKDMNDLKAAAPADLAKDFEIFSNTDGKTAGYLSDGQPTEFRIYGWVEKNHMSDTVCVSGEAGGQTLLRDSYGCPIDDPGTGAFRIYGWVDKTHMNDTVCVSGEPEELSLLNDAYGFPVTSEEFSRNLIYSNTMGWKTSSPSDEGPLLVIDGVATDVSLIPHISNGYTSYSLPDYIKLVPADINEIEVNLKPGDNYGEQGRNGVVVVTTKRQASSPGI